QEFGNEGTLSPCHPSTLSLCHLQTLRLKHRPFDADAAIIPAHVGPYRGDATEADADPAGHGRLKREMTGHAPAPGQRGDGLHHRPWTAANEMLGRFVLFEQLCDESAKPEGAVVAGQVDCCTRGTEILDAGSQVGGTDAVI